MDRIIYTLQSFVELVAYVVCRAGSQSCDKFKRVPSGWEGNGIRVIMFWQPSDLNLASDLIGVGVTAKYCWV
jgi:hypothetical protein